MDLHNRQILDHFYEKAKDLPGLYDLVLRGSGSKRNVLKPFVKDWSDLDLSIIVENINQEIRDKVREIYLYLRKYTDIKITIILVDTKDFFSKYHYHGIKDLHYRHAFPTFESLYRKDINYGNRDVENLKVYKLSCYFYISYLIHDLRKQYIACNDNISELREFFHNLVKRGSIISWNAVFFKTGYNGPDTNCEILFAEYPKLDKDFWDKLQIIRANWSELRNDAFKMNELVEYIFNNIEYIYAEVHKHVGETY